jgi:hypothetical protein
VGQNRGAMADPEAGRHFNLNARSQQRTMADPVQNEKVSDGLSLPRKLSKSPRSNDKEDVLR